MLPARLRMLNVAWEFHSTFGTNIQHSMKLSPVAQNPLEWLALKAGILPTPFIYSHFGFLLSKLLLDAIDKGVLEAIGHNKVSVEEIAVTCKLNKRALTPLLAVLATLGVLKEKNKLIQLTATSKKWLLKESPHSFYTLLMFDNHVCWKWMDYVPTFLETGKGLQYHQNFSEEEWSYYQQAMEASASLTAKEAARKIPVPAGATRMLDVGGASGLYSVVLCRKYPALTSVILDLPAAIEKAQPILHKYNMALRISYTAGNALNDDFGEEAYDVVVMANLAHHFTVEENVAVAKKAFKALKPGGIFSILEVLSSDKIDHKGNMLATVGNMFFALSSTSGLWTLSEIKRWQKEAGFTPHKKTSFLSLPGYVAVSAKK